MSTRAIKKNQFFSKSFLKSAPSKFLIMVDNFYTRFEKAIKFSTKLLFLISLSFAAKAKNFEDYIDKKQNPELIIAFHDWLLFKNDRGDQEICYLLSTPIASQKHTYYREESYFIITLNADGMDEISTSLGFYYKENSNVELSFGSKKFYLFPYRNLAWANDKNEDIDIVKAMKNSDRMFITGVSKDGELVIDIYSLVGFNQAYSHMRNYCKKLKGNNISIN